MINFIYKNIHLLFFGFLIAFSSGFGQTFFISLFSNDFRQTFDLTNTEFGSLYSIATVMSAITIIWAGKLIDTVSLKKYTLVIVLGLALTCLMASIVFNIFFLFLTIYFLRLFGQGLMGHTSRTTMARYFSINRGKALAISGFGFSIGEMIYPTIVVILLITIGWRLTWFSSFLFVFIILGGSFYFLLKRNNFQKEEGFEQHVSYKDISRSFVDSPEFSAIASSESSSDFFTTALYQNVLGREPDASGLGYWTSQLESGLQDRADVLMGFANSPENIVLYDLLA